jgi:hypothetical protein
MALTDIEAGRLADNVFNVVGANKNLIINGAMQVAQRGTSFTGLTSGNNYSADRFIFSLTSSGTATLTQSADAPVGFKNSFKIEFTAAAASPTENKIEYRFEGQDVQQLEWGTANAKGITLSFYIKSNKTGNTQFALQNSANDRSYIAPFTIDAANTWERKTIYVPGDTSGTWLTGNDIGLRIRWGFYEASRQSSTVNAWQSGIYQTRSDSPINFADTIGNTFLLSGVQLEVGSVATPFEHRSFGDELLRCQRYYQKSYNYSYAPGTTTSENMTMVYGVTNGSNVIAWNKVATVSMRTNATVTYYSQTGTVGSWGYARSGASGAATVTLYRNGENGWNSFMDLGASWVPAAVEGHWAASAEL